VVGATILPEEGFATASQRGEKIRLEVNRWIRAKGNFDAVVDFDAAVRDPAHPSRIKPVFDSGDHLHLNDAGSQALADAFDIGLFRK
jgi:lysophospholipase L1-like esterase